MRSTQVIWAAGLALFGIGLGISGFRPTTSIAQGNGNAATNGPKYAIVETDGTNLLVVDNSTNKMHFYTIDHDKQVGDELKLRGTLDLNQVGQKVIKPVVYKHE
ncbi:MAG: hypothetical protein LC104_08570 [Bacteroidales bacterium]|nr:hypothetical protein [Bacteroidales bacterium]